MLSQRRAVSMTTSALTERWQLLQSESYIKWINLHLEGRKLEVHDLATDLCDGVILANLIEVLTGTTVKYRPVARNFAHKLDNVQAVLDSIEKEASIKLVGCIPGHIVEGNMKQIMGLIFLLIQKYKDTPIPNARKSDRHRDAIGSSSAFPRKKSKSGSSSRTLLRPKSQNIDNKWNKENVPSENANAEIKKKEGKSTGEAIVKKMEKKKVSEVKILDDKDKTASSIQDQDKIENEKIEVPKQDEKKVQPSSKPEQNEMSELVKAPAETILDSKEEVKQEKEREKIPEEQKDRGDTANKVQEEVEEAVDGKEILEVHPEKKTAHLEEMQLVPEQNEEKMEKDVKPVDEKRQESVVEEVQKEQATPTEDGAEIKGEIETEYVPNKQEADVKQEVEVSASVRPEPEVAEEAPSKAHKHKSRRRKKDKKRKKERKEVVPEPKLPKKLEKQAVEEEQAKGEEDQIGRWENVSKDDLEKVVKVQAQARVFLAKRHSEILRENNLRKEQLAHRTSLVREVLTSERSYVKGLETFLAVYLKPLLELTNGNKDVKAIVSAVEVICGYNKVILSKLEKRLENWDPEKDKISDIFLSIVDYLKVYSTYIAKYNERLELVSHFAKESLELAAFLDKAQAHPDAGNLSFNSYLILPVQRIPRYVMLLAQIYQHTPQEHVDYEDLRNAWTKMREVADYLNEKKREAENLSKVLDIQKTILGLPESLAAPHRRFIRQGLLVEIQESGAPKCNHYILFNDLLLFGAPKAGFFDTIAPSSARQRAGSIGGSPEGRSHSVHFGSLKTKKKMEKRGSMRVVGSLDSHPDKIVFHDQIPLYNTAVVDVPKVEDKLTDHGYRFQLITNVYISPKEKAEGNTEQKIYTFSAQSEDEKNAWMTDLDDAIASLLESAISRRLDEEEEMVDSPRKKWQEMDFNECQKEGTLYRQDSNNRWRKRYFVLKDDIMYYFPSKKDVGRVKPEMVHTYNCTVKRAEVTDRKHCFRLVSLYRTTSFAAEDRKSMFDWMMALRTSVVAQLHTEKSTLQVQDMISKLFKHKANSKCVDCGAPLQLRSSWIVVDRGVFVCTLCAGIYRMLGYLAKSTSFGHWKIQQLNNLIKVGNEEAAKKVPKSLNKPTPSSSYSQKLEYIRSVMTLDKQGDFGGQQNNENTNTEAQENKGSSIEISVEKKGLMYMWSERSLMWKKYKFAIKDGSLHCYTKTKKKLLWAEDLAFSSVDPQAIHSIKAHNFHFVTLTRVYFLAAETSQEKESWVQSINAAKAAL